MNPQVHFHTQKCALDLGNAKSAKRAESESPAPFDLAKGRGRNDNKSQGLATCTQSAGTPLSNFANIRKDKNFPCGGGGGGDGKQSAVMKRGKSLPDVYLFRRWLTKRDKKARRREEGASGGRRQEMRGK